jgi:two-component sensor histidine kinase
MLSLQPIDQHADGSLFDLVDAIEALAGARSIEDVAAIVRTAARQIAGADGVTFVLRDGDRCWYFDEEAIGPLWKGQRFPLQSCISGWAMMNGKTAVVPDIYLDPRIPHDAYRPTFVKSLVMTPVGPKNPIAAMGAYWATLGSPPRESIDHLATLARATSTALANVQLIASLQEAVESRDYLIQEMDHRVKNTLAAVVAISNRTLRAAPSPEAFVEVFRERIQSLAGAHEHLAQRRWREADLRELVLIALSPFRTADDGSLSVAGPAVRLRPEAAVSFLMTCHELATNAAKYGALSLPEGRIEVAWDLQTTPQPGILTFHWREMNGPPVTTPQRRGFGSEMIERGFARDVGGEAHLNFATEGVRFRLTAPLSQRIMPG